MTDLLERTDIEGRAEGAPELRLLGGFDLRRGGDTVELPLNAQRLLAFVALHERPVLRVHVAASLWMDTTDDKAGANLRSTMWRIRRTGHALLASSGRYLRVDEHVRIDVRDLLHMERHRLAERVPEAGIDDRWLSFGGDLLPDWYDDWVVVERERLRQLRLHALERWCERLSASGRHGDAIDLGLAAVALEPLRESSHRAVIRAHLAEGNVDQALRQYDTFAAMLRLELDLAPSPLMHALVAPLTRRVAPPDSHGGDIERAY